MRRLPLILPLSACAGAPLDGVAAAELLYGDVRGWRRGERVGFRVTGLARLDGRNVEARTDVVFLDRPF